jgi:hypothetical protein
VSKNKIRFIIIQEAFESRSGY